MWVWRAFIFSLSIALFVAISSPARALENSPPTHVQHADPLANLPSEFDVTNDTKIVIKESQLTQAILSACFSPEQKSTLNILTDSENSDIRFPSKTPAYQLSANPNVSLPPFERQAASAFGSVVQIEPIFVLAYEFLPEILGLKHFLSPLVTNNTVPWYLRPDAANCHGRLAGWKDGNTLYTGTITYLS